MKPILGMIKVPVYSKEEIMEVGQVLADESIQFIYCAKPEPKNYAICEAGHLTETEDAPGSDCRMGYCKLKTLPRVGVTE